ncbi:hypothetical protein MVEN_00338500 [Mycena venus]|uniref:Uncharacterized protein n=1 Tax=Mycena venus TaxID=2733690 RepID=A0A8H7D728_9AGAR|nr:hypothetical protein MVEN_00338500 [Mycena venus]
MIQIILGGITHGTYLRRAGYRAAFFGRAIDQKGLSPIVPAANLIIHKSAVGNGLYLQTVGGAIYNNATEAGASVYTVVTQTAPVTNAEGTLRKVFIEDASSLYVTVSGSSVLVPTTSVRASGAIFKMNGDTLTTIEYLTTGEFVTATMPGNQPLTATAVTPSAWEEYSVFFLASGRYAIKANSNGLYLQTTSAGIVNSAFSQASGSVYNLVNPNPGRR